MLAYDNEIILKYIIFFASNIKISPYIFALLLWMSYDNEIILKSFFFFCIKHQDFAIYICILLWTSYVIKLCSFASDLSILIYGVISLPDAMSYDKRHSYLVSDKINVFLI